MIKYNYTVHNSHLPQPHRHYGIEDLRLIVNRFNKKEDINNSQRHLIPCFKNARCRIVYIYIILYIFITGCFIVDDSNCPFNRIMQRP